MNSIIDPCPPLLRLWLNIEAAAGNNLTSSLDTINDAATSDYTLSRLGEWRNGKRQIPPAVADALRRMVMPHLLRDIGIIATRRQLDLLCTRISDAPVDLRI